jgi:hypothetical protein
MRKLAILVGAVVRISKKNININNNFEDKKNQKSNKIK